MVIESRNLRKALACVRRNQGTVGVDIQTVEERGAYFEDQWPRAVPDFSAAPVRHSHATQAHATEGIGRHSSARRAHGA